MTTTQIRVTDEIVVPQPPAEVWPVLVGVSDYPRWWPESLHLRVLSERPGAIGTELELRPRGGRAFRCSVESLEEPRRIYMRYGGGFVEGSGEWRLEPLADGKRVTYDLDVHARGLIVGLVARAIRIDKLHSGPMRDVLEALKDELTARQVARKTAGVAHTPHR